MLSSLSNHSMILINPSWIYRRLDNIVMVTISKGPAQIWTNNRIKSISQHFALTFTCNLKIVLFLLFQSHCPYLKHLFLVLNKIKQIENIIQGQCTSFNHKNYVGEIWARLDEKKKRCASDKDFSFVYNSAITLILEHSSRSLYTLKWDLGYRWTDGHTNYDRPPAERGPKMFHSLQSRFSIAMTFHLRKCNIYLVVHLTLEKII